METLYSYFWLFALPVIFIAIVLYVFNPKRRRSMEADKEIPFRGKDRRDKNGG